MPSAAFVFAVSLGVLVLAAPAPQAPAVAIPRTWDQAALESLEVPLPNPRFRRGRYRLTTTIEFRSARSIAAIRCTRRDASPRATLLRFSSASRSSSGTMPPA